MRAASLENARMVKAEILRRYGDLADLVGVGITKYGDDYAVKVNLARLSARARRLPEEIDGVPIRIEVVGRPRKLAPA